MRLLLTSQSIYNESIATSLRNLLDKPSKECRAVYISTSQNAAVGDKSWFIRNLSDAHGVGWRTFEVIDVAAMIDLPKEMWWERIEQADVLFVGGGANFYLGYWFEKSGLLAVLPRLLQSKVYVGASAGSVITTHSLATASQALKQFVRGQPLDMNNLGPEGQRSPQTLGLVDVLFRPHYQAANYAYATDELLQKVADSEKRPLYALDDNCALEVVDGLFKVVAEGEWKLFEPVL